VEKITYNDFLNLMHRKWKLGQHIGVIGPTGSGKTFIVRDLLSLKKHAVAIGTKSKDKTLEAYEFTRRETWPPEWNEHHILLWKKPKNLGDYREQQALVYLTMNDLYKRGGYALYFDDLYYVAITLNLKRPVQMLYTQVRSQGVSIIASMQRPAWVPLEAVSQATYLTIFKIRSRLDVERAADGMGCDRKELMLAIGALEEYEFLLCENGKEPIHVQKREV
jgi:energy-coupling factor transporter ATP-binding protein EcfA2